MDTNITNAIELLDKAKKQGIAINAPVDIEQIAWKVLNIRIDNDYSLESRNVIGEITFEDKQPIIRINPIQNSYNARRRFTIAHEIGHFCLHRENSHGFVDSLSSMSRTESYWNTKESEANNFAAQFLMPHHLIMEIGEKVIGRYKAFTNSQTIPASNFIENMASEFQVSNPAMQYRLKNLGILS